MSIDCPINIPNLDSEAFEKLDYSVMGHAYASQNQLGRLCDECVYEADMKARLIAEGFRSVHTQVPISVTHRDFSKIYYLDLLVDGALYELKTAVALAGEHEAQLLNYLLLLGLRRGKLLNFRPPKVQGQTMAAALTPDKRRNFIPITDGWKELTPACAILHQAMLSLLQDWGAFLDIALYQEALIHFLGGVEKIEQPIKLNRNELALGTQRMYLHVPDVAFRLTAFTQGQNIIESHLRRLLALSDLQAFQWINLNHEQIEFTTITK